MINIEVPDNIEKIKQQIEALKHLIKTDQSDKDRQIHKAALKRLEEALEVGHYEV